MLADAAAAVIMLRLLSLLLQLLLLCLFLRVLLLVLLLAVVVAITFAMAVASGFYCRDWRFLRLHLLLFMFCSYKFSFMSNNP